MDYIKLFITAAVPIEPLFSLSETASKLGVILGGLSFREDESGRYDEFPSFSAEGAGLSFVLLGIPDPHDQITPVSNLCLQVQMAFCTSEAKETCDASSYFAELIRSHGELVVDGS